MRIGNDYQSDWLDNLHDQDIDYIHKEIYLGGITDYIDPEQNNGEPGVEWAMTNRFIKNLRVLDLKDGDPVNIHLNTCGGDWHQGMAIYDAIQSCGVHVTIVNYSQARSMSSLIFLAADQRVMRPHSQFMMHLGSTEGDSQGEQIVNEHNEYVKSRKVMLDIYVEAMRHGSRSEFTDGQNRAWIKRQMQTKVEVYLTAFEAVELGFADIVSG